VRRGNGDEPAKRHSAPDTSGISHFAVIHNTGARADLRDNSIRSEGNIPEFTPASVRLSAAAQRGIMCRSIAQTMGVGLDNPLDLERFYEYALP